MHVFIVVCTIFQKIVTFCSVRDDFRAGYSTPSSARSINGGKKIKCALGRSIGSLEITTSEYIRLRRQSIPAKYPPSNVSKLHLSIPKDYFERHPVPNKFLPPTGNAVNTAKPLTACFVVDTVSSKAE